MDQTFTLFYLTRSMQSFLAYRRFGRHVREQYERDQEKMAGMRRPVSHRSISSSTDSSLTATSSSPPNEITEERDLEAGEQHNARDSDIPGPGADTSNEPSQPKPAVPRPDMLHRAETARTQHSMGTALGTALTGINVRDRTTREGGEKGRVFVVGYEGEDDSLNPHNWSYLTRWAAT